MHAFRRFIEQETDDRGWTQAELMRRSGLTRQSISKLLADDRSVLPERPEDKTVDGLAKAFTVSRQVVLTHVGMAMGLPVLEPAVLYDPSGVSDDELVRELARRLKERDGNVGTDATPKTDGVTTPGAVLTPMPDRARKRPTGPSQQRPRKPQDPNQD